MLLIDNDAHNHPTVLEEFMIRMARGGKLGMCYRIIEASRPIPEISYMDRIIKSQTSLLRIALSCIYQTPYTDQWHIMNSIFLVTVWYGCFLVFIVPTCKR